jgi:hypothetical protein
VTQAVLIRTIVDVTEFDDLIRKNPGLVYVPVLSDSGRFTYNLVLTSDQRESRLEHDSLMATLFGDSSRSEPWVLADELVARMHEPGGSPIVMLKRPRTKSLLREAVKASPGDVYLEETSVFGNEFEGWLSEAPEGRYAVVGPDPRRKRSWFATIRWSEKTGWTVE